MADENDVDTSTDDDTDTDDTDTSNGEVSAHQNDDESHNSGDSGFENKI